MKKVVHILKMQALKNTMMQCFLFLCAVCCVCPAPVLNCGWTFTPFTISVCEIQQQQQQHVKNMFFTDRACRNMQHLWKKGTKWCFARLLPQICLLQFIARVKRTRILQSNTRVINMLRSYAMVAHFQFSLTFELTHKSSVSVNAVTSLITHYKPSTPFIQFPDFKRPPDCSQSLWQSGALCCPHRHGININIFI